jgi:hypothetical protein
VAHAYESSSFRRGLTVVPARLFPRELLARAVWSVICVVGLRSQARSFGGTSTAKLAGFPLRGSPTSGRTECDLALKSWSKVRCWHASARQSRKSTLRGELLAEAKC